MSKLLPITLLFALAACGDRAPDTPPPEPDAVSRERVHAFCVANYDKMMACIDDDVFWNVMATLYFQTDPELDANPAAKEPWIAMMKDAARTLHGEGELSANCDATVDNNQWPTEAQLERVTAAHDKSCAEFGNAYGYVMFGEGVFFVPTTPVD